MPIAIALTIGGSDSGGGAGIQADLKTFMALRVHGCSAISCVTAQNTLGVSRVDALPPEALTAQIEAVVSDLAVGALKTGMLLNQALIEATAAAIAPLSIRNADPAAGGAAGSTLAAMLLRGTELRFAAGFLHQAFYLHCTLLGRASWGASRSHSVSSPPGAGPNQRSMARERSGYYVSEKAIETAAPPKLAVKQAAAAGSVDWSRRLTMRPAAQANVSKPLDWQSYPYPFIYGQVDHNLFPLAEWRDCARQALGKKWLGSWTNDTWAHDDPLLVEQIRRRILPRRGIMANDDEILVTLGAQNALYLLTALLVGPAAGPGAAGGGDRVAGGVWRQRLGAQRG